MPIRPVLLTVLGCLAVAALLLIAARTGPDGRPAVRPDAPAAEPPVAVDEPEAMSVSAAAPAHVAVYYLHFTVRCAECLRIEAEAQAAIEEVYWGELSTGELTWQACNVDEPEHAPLLERFAISTPTLVIAVIRDEAVQAWRPLEETWSLVGDLNQLREYVIEGVGRYLEEARAAP